MTRNTKTTVRTIDEALSLAKEYYKDNIPKSVTEYCSNFPVGMGRTAMKTKFGITITEFLKLLNPEHEKSNKEISEQKLIELANRLNFNVKGFILGNSNTTYVTLECKFYIRV